MACPNARTSSRLVGVLVCVIAGSATVPVLDGLAPGSIRGPVAAPQEPTFVDVYFAGPIDSIYNAEYQRLSEACRGQSVSPVAWQHAEGRHEP